MNNMDLSKAIESFSARLDRVEVSTMKQSVCVIPNALASVECLRARQLRPAQVNVKNLRGTYTSCLVQALLTRPRDPVQEIRQLAAARPVNVRELRGRGYTALQVSLLVCTGVDIGHGFDRFGVEFLQGTRPLSDPKVRLAEGNM
jgi:hypothetical protein